jgi:hypothetical protein
MFSTGGVGDTSISNTTFAGNTAFGSIAGGLYTAGGGALVVRGSTFSANQATGTTSIGGGIFNVAGMPSTVVNSTFSANLAGNQGGGFYAVSPVTFTNATFSDNGAAGAGGAIFNAGAAVTLTSTILARSAAGGDIGCPLSTTPGCAFVTVRVAVGSVPLTGPVTVDALIAYGVDFT